MMNTQNILNLQSLMEILSNVHVTKTHYPLKLKTNVDME